MNARYLNLIVGLFIIAGILVFVWLGLTASNTTGRFTKQINISAEFDNIGSLKVKAPVMIAGVRIGRVTDITLDPISYKAKVSMNVDEKYELSSDTVAMIYTSGLVGEQYISLDPGGAPMFLEDGSEIRLTQSALVIERLIGQFLTSMGSGNKE